MSIGLLMESSFSSALPKVNESSEIMPGVVTFVRQTSDPPTTQKVNSLSQSLCLTLLQGTPLQATLEGLL